MNFFFKYVTLTLIIFTLATCKNKLNINAPYKEIPSVYAILNPQENIQIIRVNKVFLGEGDANAMAKIADSVNYNAGDLLITLERFVNGTKTIAAKNNNMTVTFRDSVLNTDAGAFSTQQRVYVCADKLFNTGEYRLNIKNIKTNSVFTAKSLAVDTIRSNAASSYIGPYYPVPLSFATQITSYINYLSTNTGPLSLTYKIRDGKINQVKMRFHFYDSLFNGTKDYRYIDYPFTKQLSKNATTSSSNPNFNGLLKLEFRSAELFSAFGIELSKMGLSNSIFGRRIFKVEYLIYSSNQDYSDYLDYTTPSLSLAQQKPLYSNFENATAIGIFAFRSTVSFIKESSNEFENDFATNKNTCAFKFYAYNSPFWSLPGCP